jgi:RNA polymerase sigma factor (sigma-70 family)
MSISAPSLDDAELVARSRAGSRDAFGTIVERYQATVSAVAYSLTGSVSRSEDLAQETFVTAWKRLGDLREPHKLRSWLCGIARNHVSAERRRLTREPSHHAGALGDELAAGEKPPSTLAVTAEEQALLWREIGQLPEIYREALVLYYREEQCVAAVASALELSEDAVMQRLSRGRRLLHERMLAFVEEALARTKPDRQFAVNVQLALPLLGSGAGMSSAKGLALKGGGGLWAFALPVVGMLAALGVSWNDIRQARNEPQRRFARRWHAALWGSIGLLLLALRGVAAWGERRQWRLESVLEAHTGIWFGYLVILASLFVVMYRRIEAAFRDESAAAPVDGTWSIVASYVASTGWIVGLAWLLGDGGMALLITLATGMLATWHLRELRARKGWPAQQLTFACHAALCAGLLLVVNLRLDRWLAPLYGVPLDVLREALDLQLIHLLTGLLIAWTGALFLITGRIRRAA